MIGRAEVGEGRGGGEVGGWQEIKPSDEGWYGMLRSLASILKTVGGRLPILLLAMKQLYCKLIKQHLYLLVYKPDIANAHIPMETFLARIISNQGRRGTGGLHIPKASQPWRPTQPITLHHHMAELTEELGRRKTFLSEAKGQIPQTVLSLLSLPHTHQFWIILHSIPCSFQHLVVLVVFLPLRCSFSVSIAGFS